MKTNHFFVSIFLLFNLVSFSQENQHVEVNGQIIVDRNDVEGVTVFNKSSGKGTVTDLKGKFIIEVALNDQIEFSALQFQNFRVFVTQEIIDSKIMVVLLAEQVNKLDEVVILPHNLTGNLMVDTESIKLVNPNLDALYFGLDNIDKMEFTDDHLSEVKNIALSDSRLVYGVNMVDVLGLLVSSIFKPSENSQNEPFVPIYKQPTILKTYSKEYLLTALNIKEENLVEFVFFVEENGLDLSLLEPSRELEFLETLNLKKKEYFKIKNGED